MAFKCFLKEKLQKTTNEQYMYVVQLLFFFKKKKKKRLTTCTSSKPLYLPTRFRETLPVKRFTRKTNFGAKLREKNSRFRFVYDKHVRDES